LANLYPGKKEDLMKRSLGIIWASCALLGLATLTVQAQEPTATPGINPRVLAAGFGDPAFWVALLATLIAGAVGGVVYELLILQGAVERPHKFTAAEATEKAPYAVPAYMYDLGIWARIIIGGLAALAALLVLQPDSTFALLATAVVAGSAGTSVFRSLQDRVLALMAQKDAADTRAIVDSMAGKVDEANARLGMLKQTLALGSSTAPSGRDIAGARDVTAGLDALDQAMQLLSEAKGARDSMRAR
jgi:hypothetical protein